MPKESTGRKNNRKRGDLNRKSQHLMRTHDGMVESGHFKRTPTGMRPKQ